MTRPYIDTNRVVPVMSKFLSRRIRQDPFRGNDQSNSWVQQTLKTFYLFSAYQHCIFFWLICTFSASYYIFTMVHMFHQEKCITLLDVSFILHLKHDMILSSSDSESYLTSLTLNSLSAFLLVLSSELFTQVVFYIWF